MKEIDVSVTLEGFLELIFLIISGIILVLVGVFSLNIFFILIGLGLLGYIYIQYKNLEKYFLELNREIKAILLEIDGYIYERIDILENGLKFVERKVEIEGDLLVDIFNLRLEIGKMDRNILNKHIENVAIELNKSLENFDKLKGDPKIIEIIQRNAYLQRKMIEIKDLYNEKIYHWNRELFDLPLKKIIASKKGYKTKKPFIMSKVVKEGEKGFFF